MENIKNLIKSRVESLFNETIMDMQPVADPGAVNQVYIITTDKQKLIARINNVGELPRFKKEQWCIEQAAQAGVKGAEVLDVGGNEEYAYTLTSYIDGNRADQPGIDTTNVWRAIGENAKKIHSIPSKGFGENLEDITSGSLEKWQKYLDDNLRSLSEENEFLQKGIITSKQANTIREHITGLTHLSPKLGLSHGDLSLDNVIIDMGGEVNILDWGSAEGHLVPHYDLGVILNDSLTDDSGEFTQVLEGYGLSRGEYEAIKGQIMSLMMLIAFDKVRWHIDKAPEGAESAAEHLKTVLLRAGSSEPLFTR